MKIVHWVQVFSVWLVSGEDIDAKAPIQENETFVLNNSVVYCNSIWKNCGGCVVDMKGASHYCEKVQNLLYFPSFFSWNHVGRSLGKSNALLYTCKSLKWSVAISKAYRYGSLTSISELKHNKGWIVKSYMLSLSSWFYDGMQARWALERARVMCDERKHVVLLHMLFTRWIFVISCKLDRICP